MGKKADRRRQGALKQSKNAEDYKKQCQTTLKRAQKRRADAKEAAEVRRLKEAEMKRRGITAEMINSMAQTSRTDVYDPDLDIKQRLDEMETESWFQELDEQQEPHGAAGCM